MSLLSKIILRSTVALLSCIQLSSYAAEAGFYTGLDLQYQQLDITNDDAIKLDATSSLGLYVGYNFLHMIGVEIGFSEYDDFGSDDRTGLNIAVSRAFFGINMQGELSKSFDAFAKIKASYTDFDIENNDEMIKGSKDFGWIYEVGTQWYITEMLGLTAKVSYGESSFDSDFDYRDIAAGLGLQLNF